MVVLRATRFVCCAILTLVTATAHAQPTPPVQPNAQPPVTPGSESGKPTDRDPNAAATESEPQEPLSEKLGKSEGVIEPPSRIDPEIKAPTPDINSRMPVLPPPGEPGGDQSVQPK